MTIKDGKMLKNGKELKNFSLEELTKSTDALSSESMRMDQSKLNAKVPVVHDNADVMISESQAVPFTEFMRERWGPRFDEYVYGMGQIMVELRDIVAEEMNRKFPREDIYWGDRYRESKGEVKAESYLELKKNLTGISFGKDYRGVSMRIPLSGEFLNIAVPEDMTELQHRGVWHVRDDDT